MSVPNIFKNSNYTSKYIVDADKLNENFEYLLNQIGGSPVKNLIISSGQQYSEYDASQIVTAIIQLVLGGQYFVDEGTVNEILLVPSVPTYSVPAILVDKMEFLFKPAFANTGATTMGFKGFDSTSGVKPLLDKAGNELTNGVLIANTVYTAYYDASRNGGSFILGSLRNSSSNGSADPSAELEYLVNSLGISFSESVNTQLSQAIAEYSLLGSYLDVSESSDSNAGIYRIRPYNASVALPFELHNGLTIRFKPKNSNGNSIIIDGLTTTATQILNMDGSSLDENDIVQNIDVVVRFYDNKFYIVSNKQSTLSLASGPTVNEIESTLTNNAKAVPTSAATKAAITPLENNISSLTSELESMYSNLAYKPFSVIGGPVDEYIYYTSASGNITIVSGTILRYANGSCEIIPNSSSIITNLDISTVTGAFKILYVQNVGLVLVGASNYTESHTAPTTAGSDGDAYVYIDTFGRIKTYRYNLTNTAWEEVNFVKVGFGEESSGTVSFYRLPLCGKYIQQGLAVPDFSTNSLVITHNIDSACKATIRLVCTINDLDYTVGDTICLAPFYTTTEYFSVGNTLTTTVINSTGIKLPTSGNDPTGAITAANWKFDIEIERAF